MAPRAGAADTTDEPRPLAEDADGKAETPGPGRAARPPDEGPAADGGSALDEEDAAAEEEIGGGD